MTLQHRNFQIVPANREPIVRVAVSGFWSPEVAEHYLSALKSSVDRMRRRFGFVHVLIDAREGAVHPQETVERLKTSDENFRGADDRVAMVVATFLKKQQAARVLPTRNGRAFVSVADAEKWLTGQRAVPAETTKASPR